MKQQRPLALSYGRKCGVCKERIYFIRHYIAGLF